MLRAQNKHLTDLETKLSTWPKIGPNDLVGSKEFSVFFLQVNIVFEHIPSLKVLNYPSQIQRTKYLAGFKAKLSNRVLKLQRRESRDAFQSFKEFVEEVRYHAEWVNITKIVQSPVVFSTSVPESVRTHSRSSRRPRT